MKMGVIEGGNGRCVKAFSITEEFYVISIRLNGVYIKWHYMIFTSILTCRKSVFQDG